MKAIVLLFLIAAYNNTVSAHFGITVPDEKHVFDLDLYESVLDSKLCEEQIRYIQQEDQGLLLEYPFRLTKWISNKQVVKRHITNPSTTHLVHLIKWLFPPIIAGKRIIFLVIDAGIRVPTGIMTGNMLHLGSYYQCLGINKPTPNSVIEGKYCMIRLPLNQRWPSMPNLPEDIPLPDFDPKKLRLKEDVVQQLKQANLWAAGMGNLIGVQSNISRVADGPLAALTLHLAVCIPKPCTTHTALSSFFNSSELNSVVNFEETFCRLPNDKPWVAGDYVAVSIFSFIGLLVLLSTSYDLYHNVFQQKDPQKPPQANKLLVAFSIYTNTRRLVTYTPVPGALECLDGIRSFAMMWVIIGHSFGSQPATGHIGNMIYVFEWMTSLKSIWITSAPITVDTFFMLSGLLIVYTTAGKLSSMKLLKNLHLFYLNRLLRMFPVLATVILLQASILNRVADGPLWNAMINETHRCRVYWWSTLLHIQNYINPAHTCLGHSWYLAVDVQLHILSPIVLVWVLAGKRKLAWSALVGALIAVLAASTTYNFIKKFPPGTNVPTRPEDSGDYVINYYVNTLTRASPFFVGLIFGYILHLYRGRKVVIPLILSTLIWICAFTVSTLIIYSTYPIAQMDWDNEIADGLINSFMRPAWAAFVGWLIFACVHGYGGPVNWVLSLRLWKVISRLSYAMYLVHYPMMFLVNSMPVAPKYFTFQFAIYQFLADLSLAILVAFVVTVMIDSPCSVIIKHFMGGGAKKAENKQ